MVFGLWLRFGVQVFRGVWERLTSRVLCMWGRMLREKGTGNPIK